MFEDVGGEGLFDAGERIFVAVGKNVEKGKKTMLWAVESFVGKGICVLHVHRPHHVLALTSGNLARRNLKQNAIEAFRKLERQRINELLDEYLLLLDQAGVDADKILIEMDNVEQGIIEAISRYNIRWLVMGAAADKYYSEELLELKSEKAIFVCREAPVFCSIWFVCNGYLIYTRVGRNDKSETDTASRCLQRDSNAREKQSESAVRSLGFLDSGNITDVLENELSSGSRSSEHPSWSSNEVVGASGSNPPLSDEALERLCVKEISQRKEMEDLLAREKEETLRTKNDNEYYNQIKLSLSRLHAWRF